MSAKKTKPLPPVTVHFLGTSAGSGPTTNRNCSSLAVHFGNEIWLFDTADGTLPRLLQVPLKPTNITRIFITHMHADHVLGVVEILLAALYPPDLGEPSRPSGSKGTEPKGPAKVNVYGPKGLRKMIRTTLEITLPSIIDSREFFAVHEVLLSNESPSAGASEEELLGNEVPGQDLRPDDTGIWRDVVAQGSGHSGKGWGVHAGPIEHRVTSLGYVLEEPTPRLPLDTARLIPLLQSNAAALAALDPPVKHPLSLLSHLASIPPPPPYTLPSGEVLHPPEPSGIPPRKLIIFGDCTGGTKNPAFADLCRDASLMVHECTRAAVPEYIQPSKKNKNLDGMTAAELEELEESKRAHASEKALLRGHASPKEIGAFVRETKPKRLILNHFSSMFSAPRYTDNTPLPSILSGMAPHPYPSARATSQDAPEVALTPAELQARLIMQSVADQIGDIWRGTASGLNELENTRRNYPMIVPSRDFMAITIGSHELSDTERRQVIEHLAQVKRVVLQWRDRGREWLAGGNLLLD